MDALEALILGIIQGLTEFLPVSSSGHIELGKHFMNVKGADDLTFTIIVHFATVLSTVVVFRKDIAKLIAGVLKFQWNDDMRFFLMILISMVPAGLVGFLFKDKIEELFVGEITLVGCCLVATALILSLSMINKGGKKGINPPRAVLLGLAQAVAILPGISRSGATISTALFLGVDKEKATRFSFLMVIPLVLGATLLDAKKLIEQPELMTLSMSSIAIGFVAAFIAGLIACKWMVSIVKKGKLTYFAIYCLLMGIVAIILGLTD
jgi:undecaprenyl-diphosphatase